MELRTIFSEPRARTELFSAVVAGLSAGLVMSLVAGASHPPGLSFYFEQFALGLATYPAVAMVRLLWLRRAARWLPGWLTISVAGSFFFVVADLLPAVIRGWANPLQTRLDLTGYLATEISAASSVVLVLVLITLPLTAAIQLRQELFGAMKRWHDGPTAPTISWPTRN